MGGTKKRIQIQTGFEGGARVWLSSVLREDLAKPTEEPIKTMGFRRGSCFLWEATAGLHRRARTPAIPLQPLSALLHHVVTEQTMRIWQRVSEGELPHHCDGDRGEAWSPAACRPELQG